MSREDLNNRYHQLEADVEEFERAVVAGEDTSIYRNIGERIDGLASDIEHRPSHHNLIIPLLNLTSRVANLVEGRR